MRERRSHDGCWLARWRLSGLGLALASPRAAAVTPTKMSILRDHIARHAGSNPSLSPAAENARRAFRPLRPRRKRQAGG